MKKIIRLVESIKEVNNFSMSYNKKSSEEIVIKFAITSQCALVFALLQSMLIEHIVFTLVDGYNIEVLDFSKNYNA